MTAAVDSMCWKGETPWHGEGKQFKGVLTPEQMLVEAGLNWTVSKRKMFYEGPDGKHLPSDTDFALIRDDNGLHLTTVGATWKEVQNASSLGFFKKFTDSAQMDLETAGSLWGGRYVWALARLGQDFSIGRTKDELRSYLLLASPHVHGKALLAMYTNVRVVCWNTLTAAIGYKWGDKVKSKEEVGFRIPHSMEFNDETKKKAEEALGLATKQAIQFKEVANLLAKTKVSAKDTEDYFCEVLQHDPKKAEKKKNGEPMEPQMLPKFRAALTHAPGQQMSTTLGTLWGSFNAVTATIDHQIGNERTTALKNMWFGHTAGIKRRALDLAIARSK